MTLSLENHHFVAPIAMPKERTRLSQNGNKAAFGAERAMSGLRSVFLFSSDLKDPALGRNEFPVNLDVQDHWEIQMAEVVSSIETEISTFPFLPLSAP